jgi:hypothetical protein
MRTVFIVIGTSSSLEATIWVPSGIPSSVLFQVGRQDGPHEPSMSYTRKYLPHSHLQSLTLSGCIPVLFGDQTHHPFWDFLDWTKFSVNIPDNQVNRLEEILLSYTWLEIQHLQTNLILIRDAVLYPAEPDMSPNLKDRGPFFFAMHSTALLRKTLYPG